MYFPLLCPLDVSKYMFLIRWKMGLEMYRMQTIRIGGFFHACKIILIAHRIDLSLYFSLSLMFSLYLSLLLPLSVSLTLFSRFLSRLFPFGFAENLSNRRWFAIECTLCVLKPVWFIEIPFGVRLSLVTKQFFGVFQWFVCNSYCLSLLKA